MLPAAEVGSDPSPWRPNVRSLRDANDALASDDNSKRRFSIAGTGSTAAGVHLRKMVSSIVDKTVDRLPGPAATVFSSVIYVLSGGPLTCENVTRWLELLLEGVYAEEEGLGLVPEAHASRIFRAMGCYVKVSEDRPSRVCLGLRLCCLPAVVDGGLS